MRNLILIALQLVIVTQVFGSDGTKYRKPPPEIEKILESKMLPVPMVSPARDTMLLLQPIRNPPLAILAEPQLRLGGLRINPLTNGESNYPMFYTEVAIKILPDGAIRPIRLPADVRMGTPVWNSTGSRFVFANETRHGTELWVVDAKTAKAHSIPGLKLNTLLGFDKQWLGDHESLLVKIIPRRPAQPASADALPLGPKIEASEGVKTSSSTYEVRDVLKTPHDAQLFDYYASSQLAVVNTRTNKIQTLGKPAIYGDVLRSPDGKHLLVESLHSPYSYSRTYVRFPRKIEVWSMRGKVEESLADLPLADSVPIRGVPIGPRHHEWIKNKPASVIWVEALDGGNPKVKVPHRDRLMTKEIGQMPRELFQLEERMEGLEYVEGGLALVHEYNDDKHWLKTFLVDLGDKTSQLKLLDSHSEDDHYGDPGAPLYRLNPSEINLVKRFGDWIYRQGIGSSPEGDRPFLDQLNVVTLQSERLFRSDREHFEKPLAFLHEETGQFLTRRESPGEPPNVYLRTLSSKALVDAVKGEAQRTSAPRALTEFVDPTPQIRGITKRIVNYQRQDGVKLSFTLYLPPGYKEGTRLPTIFYAYPLDYAEANVAGQVTGSTRNFITLTGTTHLFFLLRGYAVLDNVSMPVVGPTATIYDTYLKQLNMDAKAAIDKAVALGVTDSKRVGVLGHSHGAMMTANLLAHSDLFAAGIARSGAYNKTLTMFGFQNERRPLFDARNVYFDVSPTLHAELIKKPLLLIHGENDSNPGTIPRQSELLYEAVRGTGGTVRLVMLPFENHGYLAEESVAHVMYEEIAWFDRYVKGESTAVPSTGI